MESLVNIENPLALNEQRGHVITKENENNNKSIKENIIKEIFDFF